MEDIIQQLKNAIVTIDNKYFQRKERDFSYEIYHQMRRYEYQFNVEVSSESVKNRFSLDDEILQDKLIRSCFFNVNQDINRNIIRFPDLIFHEYDTLNHQELAIEIKKIFNPELIARDIAKLAVYCYGRLKYKKGIFILVNPNPRRDVLEVPNVRELLERFPEIEIWIARPSQGIEVICSKTI